MIAGGVRPPHRFPLSDRCAHAGRGAGDPAGPGARQGRAHRRARGEGLSRLHHLGRLARLFRRQAPPALPRGGGRRHGLSQDQGRPRPGRRQAALRHPPGGDRPRPLPDDRCQSDLGCGGGDRLGHRAGTLPPPLDRGADQPRRRAGPCRHPQGGEAARHRGGDRRDVPEPGDLQAAHAGRRDRFLPDRFLPSRRRQRGAGGAADGAEVRDSRSAPMPAASASANMSSISR